MVYPPTDSHPSNTYGYVFDLNAADCDSMRVGEAISEFSTPFSVGLISPNFRTTTPGFLS